MKTLLATAAAATVLGTAAFASGPVAPAPYVAPVTVAPVATYDWTGAYAGAGVTYGRMGMDTNGGALDYPDATGWGGSVIAGYNWQQGNMVYGGEVALDFSNRDGSNDCGIAGQSCDSFADHQASIRGRVGYAMDRSLMFMTVGYGSDSRSVRTSVAGGDGARFTGPMLGVGYEQAVGNGDWTMRGDLEHYFYGDEDLNGVTTDGDSSLVRFSLIRRF
ncbi:outer membrane protein [Pararhodobacter sp. CCB-MM2]|uniref:outer membrane protein n=1 Tax=Pararhodobacter sp. CCB-MM2 TaxID=1786003 RepID=UPI000832A78A|nr:outer membrane beta-barrel protein [Pararhodobacter sp. CCB-MM2]MCA2011368.1 outer membrane beta-barrel protein [Cereibacter sphaeroides]